MVTFLNGKDLLMEKSGEDQEVTLILSLKLLFLQFTNLDKINKRSSKRMSNIENGVKICNY